MIVEALLFVLTRIQPAIEDVRTIKASEDTVTIVELINACWNIVLGDVQTILKFAKKLSTVPVNPNGSLVTRNEFSLNELITISIKGKKKATNRAIARISSKREFIFLRLFFKKLLGLIALFIMIQSPFSC
jgi:hypothetical protein